ncbi:MAG: hypothetical protein AABY22_17885 [Nanoarchaeota archaeon]
MSSKKSVKKNVVCDTVVTVQEEATPSAINLQALQALGVDMKLTKGDILEYLTAQIEEQIKDEMKKLSSKSVALEAAHTKLIEDKILELKKILSKDPKVKNILEIHDKLQKAITEYSADGAGIGTMLSFQTDVRLTLSGRGDRYHLYIDFKKEQKYIECRFGYSSLAVAKVVLYSAEEYGLLVDEVDKINRQLGDLEHKLHNINSHVKSAKMALLRSILENSNEGKTLLDFLDSRSRNFKILSNANGE